MKSSDKSRDNVSDKSRDTFNTLIDKIDKMSCQNRLHKRSKYATVTLAITVGTRIMLIFREITHFA